MIAWVGMKRTFAGTALIAVVAALTACTGGGVGGIEGAYQHPAIGDNFIYISGADGRLYALDRDFQNLSTGERDTRDIGNSGWSEPVGDPLDPEALVGGPVLDQEQNIVMVGSEDGNLYAFDATDGGDHLWSFPTGDKIWSTPVIRNGIVYFGSHDNNLYAVRYTRDAGEEEWRYPTGGAVAGRPLLFNDLVIVGSFDRKLYGLDAASGTPRWATPIIGGNWFWAGAVADDSTIFAPNMDGNIYAVDREGRLRWQCDLGSPIVSRPAVTAGSLFVASKNGRNIFLLDTSPNPDLSCEQRIDDRQFITNSEIKAPLFVVGDSLYVGTQGSNVIRLDLDARKRKLEEAWCFDTKENRECQ